MNIRQGCHVKTTPGKKHSVLGNIHNDQDFTTQESRNPLKRSKIRSNGLKNHFYRGFLVSTPFGVDFLNFSVISLTFVTFPRGPSSGRRRPAKAHGYCSISTEWAMRDSSTPSWTRVTLNSYIPGSSPAQWEQGGS